MILGLTPAAPAMQELSLPSTAKSLTNMDNQPQSSKFKRHISNIHNQLRNTIMPYNKTIYLIFTKSPKTITDALPQQSQHN